MISRKHINVIVKGQALQAAPVIMNWENSYPPGFKRKGRTPDSTGSEPMLIPSRSATGLAHKSVIKVKRRKSKKERNSLKFKSTKEAPQKKAGPHSHLHAHDGSSNILGLKVMGQPATTNAFPSKQVFITQHRLTQHQGIFSREVKSINIERLIRETPDIETTKTEVGMVTVLSEGNTPQNQTNLTLDIIPTPKEKPQEDLPFTNQITPEMVTHLSETASDLTQHVQKDKSELVVQERDSHPKVILSSSGIGASPESVQEDPIHQVAESIHKMLSLLVLFPDRNLVSETRQSILDMKSHLCGEGSNLSPLPVQRKPNYSQRDDSCTPTTSVRTSASEDRRDVRKSIQRPQIHMQQLETSPIRFMPFPRESPAHTLIKMVNSEEDQKRPSPVFCKTVRCEPGHTASLQYHHIVAEDFQHPFTMPSPRNDFSPSRLYGPSRDKEKHHQSVHMDNPQSRWTLFPDNVLNTHSFQEENHLTRLRQDRVSRQPFVDMSSEHICTSQQRARNSSYREIVHSFDVLHNVQNLPATKMFGAPPLESRTCYPGQNSPLVRSKRKFECRSSTRPGHAGARGSTNHLEDSSLGWRNIKQTLPNPQEAKVDPPWNISTCKDVSKLKNVNHPGEHPVWSLPSSMGESTIRRVSWGSNHSNEWQGSNSWSERTSHQCNLWKPRPITIPQFQENSFNSPNTTSFTAVLPKRRSPETWIYPRMKLY